MKRDNATCLWLNLVAVLVCVVITGCVTSINSRQPFAEYAGHDLKLQKDAVLVDSEELTGGLDLWLALPRKSLCLKELNNLDSNSSSNQVRYALPQGTTIHLIWVKRFIGDGQTWIQAKGSVLVPNTKGKIIFFYAWGFEGEINRAPWEDISVPQTRKVFDY